MPIRVDVERRLREISAATLKVAAREGASAVTYRSVAAELGASTTVVTNHLPTRVALLLNCLAHVRQEWTGDMDRVMATASDGQRLHGKTRGTAKLKNGRVTLKLPKLKVGKHRVRATYLGTDTAKKSKSNLVRIKVVKRRR